MSRQLNKTESQLFAEFLLGTFAYFTGFLGLATGILASVAAGQGWGS
jgi:hypothetical protein